MSCILAGVPVLILACPAWVVLHVTAGAVDTVIAAVDVRDHSPYPCHLLVIVHSAVPTGARVDRAGLIIILERGEQQVLVIIERLEVAPWERFLL